MHIYHLHLNYQLLQNHIISYPCMLCRFPIST
ncbi:hypothetical protein DCAR_0728109 [Daucus carota subsp. sativus]|uniref:Uncharacterized protein n=1 Tax=Daucus carota subsp. sativus TaxID=79200 RepID=A0AAF0XJ28_DAUCS|nr:hypothetical protein DCAR_0728109 [Daucus carota subsp. sativus]